MAIVVENGAGLPNAEAYVSVAEADTYFSNRNDAVWAASNIGEKEAAIRNATDFLSEQYGLRWIGARMTDVQALDFPRLTYGVPIQIKTASFVLARRALDGNLYGGNEIQAPGPVVQRTEKLGPIEETVRYGTVSQTVDMSAPVIESDRLTALLSRFLAPVPGLLLSTVRA